MPDDDKYSNYDFYSPDNYIETIRYTVTLGKDVVLRETRSVDLARKYTESQTSFYYSGYEFKHDFHLENSGEYQFELQTVDKNGADVAGGSETFTVKVD